MFDWDEAKRQANLAKHGVDFADADNFDWMNADVGEDERFPYGEPRLVATGPIGTRLHVLIFTVRGGARRIISLRKANKRDKQRWLANRLRSLS